MRHQAARQSPPLRERKLSSRFAPYRALGAVLNPSSSRLARRRLDGVSQPLLDHGCNCHVVFLEHQHVAIPLYADVGKPDEIHPRYTRLFEIGHRAMIVRSVIGRLRLNDDDWNLLKIDERSGGLRLRPTANAIT